jgi:hypothetical protein
MKGSYKMRRKFALIAALAAICALAIPATSGANTLQPINSQFEIAGGSTGPKLSTSLGSCSISSIKGSTGLTGSNFNLPAPPTIGSCTSGTTATLTPGMITVGPNYTVGWYANQGGVTLRFASLPGCKLSNESSPVVFWGTWSNGRSEGVLLKSGFHADGSAKLSWSNDGGSCALAGTQETVNFEDKTSGSLYTTTIVNTVTNLSSKNLQITWDPS